MKTRITCLILALVLALLCLSACGAKGKGSSSGSDTTSDEPAGSDDFEYDTDRLPDYLSKKQKREIADLCNEAYADEQQGLDPYLNDYILMRTGHSPTRPTIRMPSRCKA